MRLDSVDVGCSNHCLSSTLLFSILSYIIRVKFLLARWNWQKWWLVQRRRWRLLPMNENRDFLTGEWFIRRGRVLYSRWRLVMVTVARDFKQSVVKERSDHCFQSHCFFNKTPLLFYVYCTTLLDSTLHSTFPTLHITCKIYAYLFKKQFLRILLKR